MAGTRRRGLTDAAYREAAARLCAWYPANARDLPWRRDKDPYRVWVSEIMLQQTRVEAVKDYYVRFLQAFPAVQDLARADEETVLKLWEGLGYYSRARNLQKAARLIAGRADGQFPQTYEEIRALPGVGGYTAGAIASICMELPEPAVDGNVLRVYARLTEERGCTDKPAVRTRIREDLKQLYRCGSCGTLTQALMELGETLCLPKGTPGCSACPLAELCLAHAHGTWAEFPVREAKKPRKTEARTVLLLCRENRTAVRKRTAPGLLHGLWEFPNFPGTADAAGAAVRAAELGLAPQSVRQETGYTHIFTHIEWHMTVYRIECGAQSPDFLWLTPAELAEKTAVPSAFRPCLRVLQRAQ